MCPIARKLIAGSRLTGTTLEAMCARRSCLLGDLLRPCCEINHHIADEAARGLVGELAVRVELGLSLTDQDLGFVERVHVEKNAAAAQIVLGARGAGHAGGSAEH